MTYTHWLTSTSLRVIRVHLNSCNFFSLLFLSFLLFNVYFLGFWHSTDDLLLGLGTGVYMVIQSTLLQKGFPANTLQHHWCIQIHDSHSSPSLSMLIVKPCQKREAFELVVAIAEWTLISSWKHSWLTLWVSDLDKVQSPSAWALPFPLFWTHWVCI